MRRTAAVLLLLATLAAGCARVRPDEAATPARPGAHARRILLDDGFLEVRVEAPDAPPGPKPTVISYVEELREPLLDAGFTVASYTVHWELLRGLAPPAAEAKPAPGEPPAKPVGKWLLASPSADVIGQGYLHLIEGNARITVAKILDALATDPDVDPRRIGIVGVSTNGFAALQAGCTNRRLRAVVAIVACGDYHTFLHQSSLALEGAPLNLKPEYDRWLRDIEPMRHPERLLHASVLMVNGRRDRAIPIACAESTARALRRAYAAAGTPERFRWVVEDDGHVVGARAKREAMDWLRRWLGNPELGHERGEVRVMDVLDDEPVGAKLRERGTFDADRAAGRWDAEQLAGVGPRHHPAVGVPVAVDDEREALEPEIGECPQQRRGALSDGGAAPVLVRTAGFAHDGVGREHRGDRVRVVRVPGGIRRVVRGERRRAPVDGHARVVARRDRDVSGGLPPDTISD
jgi:hypothetical protein